MEEKLGTPLRIYGHLLRVTSVLFLILYLLIGALALAALAAGQTAQIGSFDGSLAAVLGIISMVLGLGTSVGMFVVGGSLIHGQRRRVARGAYVLLWLTVIELVLRIMLTGTTGEFVTPIAQLVILTVLSLRIDPELTAERRLRQAQAREADAQAAEEGTLGRDESGRGYLSLNFYNLFWIFVVCSLIGLILETIWHPLMVEPGVIQDRAGMLYGPFSPIYGFGAVLMTVALNRLYNRSFVIIFLASGVIGGAFEFAVSWFLEIAFGITAWDYSGTFLSIDGRTNGFFMAMWGLLGLVWIKLLLPHMLMAINLLPVRMRGAITSVCAALMLVNGIMTLQSIDCWFMRSTGIPSTTPIEEFYDRYYPDDVMQARFESMSIDPSKSARA